MEKMVLEKHIMKKVKGIVKDGAVDFILEKAKEGDVSIIALGPLTNLARALERTAYFGQNSGSGIYGRKL